MKKKVVIYIDLDHTLLNTEKFKFALAQSVEQFGINKKQFGLAYEEVRKTSEFAIKAFTGLLTQDEGVQKRLETRLESIANDAASFLYADAAGFLESMHGKGIQVVIFTYGDREFQQMKVDSLSRVNILFDRVIITTDKRKRGECLSLDGSIVVVDDRLDVLDQYKGKAGVFPVLLDRVRKYPASEDLYRCDSLSDLEATLREQGMI